MKTNTPKFHLAWVTALLLLTTGILQAQELKLNVYSAYTFNDHLRTYDADGTIIGGWQYGGGVEMRFGPLMGAELLYQRMDSRFPYYYYPDHSQGTLDFGLNYIMLATNKYLPLGRLEPFGGLLVGMAVVDIKNFHSGDIVKFAWGCRLGTDITLSPALALRIQGQFTSVVQSLGGGLNFGLGGVSPSINTYSSMFQFNLGGGLVYTIPVKR